MTIGRPWSGVTIPIKCRLEHFMLLVPNGKLNVWKSTARPSGYRVEKSGKEIGAGVTDNWAKFLARLEEQCMTPIVVEQKDRATRFRYVEALLRGHGHTLDVVTLANTHREDVLHDLVWVL
jgi:predicted site-specific integrase-resolvase